MVIIWVFGILLLEFGDMRIVMKRHTTFNNERKLHIPIALPDEPPTF